MSERHPLLRRQLRRCFGDGPVPREIETLLAEVDRAYQQADVDRRLSERALDLTSQELLERNRRLRAFFESAPSGMGTLRVKDAEVVLLSYNAAAAELFAGENGQTAIAPIATWAEHARDAATTGRRARFEYVVRIAGVDRSCAAVIAPIGGDEADTYCFVVEDVTKQKQTLAQLAQQERLASIGTLAAGIAHELNNPLSYVVSNVAFASEELRAVAAGELAPDEIDTTIAESLRAIEEARRGADRAAMIVRDLRTFARSEAKEAGPVDLHAVIGFVCRVASSEVRNRATLRSVLTPVPPAYGDETRLGQVLLNLVVNAAHAILPGRPDANEVLLRTGVSGDGAPFVEVTDTGSGIDPAVLPRIFDPFYTSKPVGVGSGLGLSISSSIVQSLGGSIAVTRTELGKGTTFRVQLRPAEGAAKRSLSVRRSAATRRRGRVLVIDDDRPVADGVRLTLQREQEVVVALGGLEALRVLATDDDFDIVLCDLRMPDVDGAAVHAEMKRRAPDLASRFVFLSGDPGEERGGIDDDVDVPFLQKPFQPVLLRQLVGEAVRRRRGDEVIPR